MRDLRADMGDLYHSLSSATVCDPGRSVMFIAAREGAGVSSISASFALLAAAQARRSVWLVDVDLPRNTQFNAFAVGPFARPFGGVGPPYAATLKTQPFFSLEPDDGYGASGLGLFTAHRVGDTRLMVTQFDATRMKAGQAIRIRAQPTYWQTVSSIADWTVVDVPALERSRAGLVIASQMDFIVIVARADATTSAEIEHVRREIESQGGRISGVVLNRRKGDASLVDRLAR